MKRAQGIADHGLLFLPAKMSDIIITDETTLSRNIMKYLLNYLLLIVFIVSGNQVIAEGKFSPYDLIDSTFFLKSVTTGQLTVVYINKPHKFVYSLSFPQSKIEETLGVGEIVRHGTWFMHENENRENLCIRTSYATSVCYQIAILNNTDVSIKSDYKIFGKKVVGLDKAEKNIMTGVLPKGSAPMAKALGVDPSVPIGWGMKGGLIDAILKKASIVDGDEYRLLKGYADRVNEMWKGPMGKAAALFGLAAIASSGDSSGGNAGCGGGRIYSDSGSHCSGMEPQFNPQTGQYSRSK